MQFLNALKQRFNSQPPPRSPNRPDSQALNQALETGMRLKRAEQYADALENLNEARQLAIASGNTGAMFIAALGQAEVFMGQERWGDADELLQETHRIAKEIRQKTYTSYLFSAQGTLAQKKNDWTGAQSYYQQALEIARSVHAVGAEGRAMGHLADTYLHDSNASYAVHLLREAIPKINMAGDLEISTYFVGRLGEAQIASGQIHEGQQLLERALKLAKQTGYRQYERRWGLLLGERAFAEGRPTEAYDYLREALSLFSPHNQTAAYAAALCQISKVCLSLRNVSESIGYARQAVQTAQQAGDERSIHQANVTMGITLVANQEYEAAIPPLKQAIESASAGHESLTGYSTADILRHLATAYGEMGNTEIAIQTYHQALAQAEKSGSRLEVAHAHRDLGLFLVKHRQLHDGIREQANAANIYEAEQQFSQSARLYCDLAVARRFVGQGARAMKDYERALMLLNNLDDDWETRGLVLSHAANAYVDQGDIDSVESFFNESISIARRLNDRVAEATRRGNYGWFLLMTGRPQQAISTLEYALQQSREHNLNLQAAIQTDNLGSAQDFQGNYQRGLELHQEALIVIRLNPDTHWESVFKINQSSSLIGLGALDEAKSLLETTLARGRADEDIEVIIRSLLGLARIALSQPAKQTTPILDEAVRLARQADMRRLLAEALSIFSEYQASIRQPQKASALWEEARRLFAMLHAPQAKLKPAWLNP
jgi:tetratricopeptide (TPR) repeat protein